ncbi:MAG: hypothetical protein Q4A74_01530 [Cardiobacteriaceae bacterium]|nr:hypothetical protein [Cardiobacteriaceae bacterium]
MTGALLQKLREAHGFEKETISYAAAWHKSKVNAFEKYGRSYCWKPQNLKTKQRNFREYIAALRKLRDKRKGGAR